MQKRRQQRVEIRSDTHGEVSVAQIRIDVGVEGALAAAAGATGARVGGCYLLLRRLGLGFGGGGLFRGRRRMLLLLGGCGGC